MLSIRSCMSNVDETCAELQSKQLAKLVANTIEKCQLVNRANKCNRKCN